MKYLLILASLSLLSLAISDSESSHQGNNIPSIILKDMEGKQINTSEISNDGNPIVISFWATWCKCCEGELNTISDLYDDWRDETGVRYIAVSIDDEKTKNMVEPTVNASGWEFDIWMDSNSDLKRAMGVNTPPHTFLFNGDLELVYSHVGYVPGDEEELYDQILAISE